MKKKENIEHLARIIVNRVKYHAPIVYNDEIDFRALEEFGIDLSLPVFKFENELSKSVQQAFKIAKNIVNFNLIATKRNNCNFALFLPTDKVSLNLLQSINKLNINYKTNSNYNLVLERNYLRINGQELKLKYNNFSLEGYANIDGILISEKEFVCNGKTMFIEVCNSNKVETRVRFEFNRNLDRGNYYIGEENRHIKVVNLFSREMTYLNTNLNVTNAKFSSVDGLYNSSYACINFCDEVVLKPYQRKVFFVNFGKKKFSLKNEKEYELLFDFAIKKCYENFNIKIESDDKKIDEKFNKILPREIWISWLSEHRDFDKEREYISFKDNVVVCENKKIYFVCKNYQSLKKIKIYDGNIFKDVVIKKNANFDALKIGKTNFVNLKTIFFDKFKRENEICLQFK